VAGAIASQQPYYGDCYMTRQAYYDDYGNFMGYHHVRVCN
jgi:hypothetical protein